MSLKTPFSSRLLQIIILLISSLPIISSDQIRAHLGKHEQINNIVYLPVVANGGPTYYLSPDGDDSSSGTSEDEAWATFDRALNKDTPGNKLQPGDTLVLLDGVYTQSLEPNLVGGQPGKPITIRAQHDGKAVIDGQGMRIPVQLVGWRKASYYVIEGIIARNSSGSVYRITADNNVFRRVSGYNANTDGNEHVFVIWANHTILEDCVAAGSGRKMILVFASTNTSGQHNVVRRCFASWREWDGREWHDEWPWNENFEVYGGDYNIFENDIAYGFFADAGFSLLSNAPTADSVGNKILGSIAIMGGRDLASKIINWGNIRPQPTQYELIKDLYNPSNRVGFVLGHAGNIQNNLLQDILAWGNASMGIKVDGDQMMMNNVVSRATIYNNGLDATFGVCKNSVDAYEDDLSRLSVTNSRIDVVCDPYTGSLPSVKGEGARLEYQYYEGVYKDGSDGTSAQPLWPWPMEQRIRDELGISVTNLIAGIVPDQVAPISDADRPFLSVSPPVQAFGNVKLDQPSAKLVNLKNTGNATLAVDGYRFDIANSPFSVTSGGTCPTPPFSLIPLQSCSVEITFRPKDYHAQTNDLYFFSSNIAPYPSAPSVYLSGIGYSTSSPLPLPGKLEAEAFTNSYGSFQIKPTPDDGGSGKIGNIEGGAWLEYPVDVTQTGQYNIAARLASIPTESNIQFSLAVDGIYVATFFPPDIGRWDTFENIAVSGISLTQGKHTIKINLTTGSFDLNYLKFAYLDQAPREHRPKIRRR